MTATGLVLGALAAVAPGLPAQLMGVTPTPVPEPTAATGPGIWGFLVTFALVVACIPLFLSMTRKVRGVAYRDGVTGAPGTAGPDGPGAPGSPGGPGIGEGAQAVGEEPRSAGDERP